MLFTSKQVKKNFLLQLQISAAKYWIHSPIDVSFTSPDIQIVLEIYIISDEQIKTSARKSASTTQ